MPFDFSKLKPISTEDICKKGLKMSINLSVVNNIKNYCGIRIGEDHPSLYPSFLPQEIIHYLHPEYEDDNKEGTLDAVVAGLKMASAIIASGDKPLYDFKPLPPYEDIKKDSNGWEIIDWCHPIDCHYGLSARLIQSDKVLNPGDNASHNKDEKETLLNKTYYWMSWLKGHVPVCIAPTDVKPEQEEDPMGCYFSGGFIYRPLICVFPEKIKEVAADEMWKETPDALRYLTIITVIHEFAHAIMDECWSENASAFHLQDMLDMSKDDNNRLKEEAFANGIMLNYLNRWAKCNPDKNEAQVLFDFAKKFANNQDKGYNWGIEYMTKDWYAWYQEKRTLVQNRKKNTPNYLIK